MLKHLDDRRRCPHCRREIDERPYVMARRAGENVISNMVIAWAVVAVLLLLLVVH
jgi:hypothetical protein